jgi:drug/metabolite transporter (DMT)-like permease
VRRPTTLELMLLGTVLLWSLNLTMTRYILLHGFRPLAYATVRYGLAASLFAGITLGAERSLRIARRDLGVVAVAALAIFANQVTFVYGLKQTTASVVALILGATPIFAALLGLGLKTEHLSGRFWLGAGISFGGVALVALGAGGQLSGDLGGILISIMTAATWAIYSVAVTHLMQRYSPKRISAVVLSLGWIGIAAAGAVQTTGQDYGLGWRVWTLLVLATLGPLVLTNILYFRSLHRIGASRATLATNLQPFVAAVIAVILLSESITAVQVAGGVCIALGIFAARRSPTVPAPAAE